MTARPRRHSLKLTPQEMDALWVMCDEMIDDKHQFEHVFLTIDERQAAIRARRKIARRLERVQKSEFLDD